MRVERYAGAAWYHGRQPDDPRALLLQVRHGCLDRLRHLGGICCPGAQHDLDLRHEIRNGLEQIAQAFLLGHAAQK